MKQKKCVSCGADITHRGSRAVRCVRCADQHTRTEARIRKGREPNPRIDAFMRPIPEECVDCVFYNQYLCLCAYAEVTGHTRLGLHKGERGSINNPCRERQVGKSECNGLD